MIIKNGSSKILKVASTISGLSGSWKGGLLKRASNNMERFDLDPDRHIYLRNRAVSALELHGPNQNWDAFEHDELEKTYSSFIGKPISIDHDGSICIGTVLDSEFIPSKEAFASFGLSIMPLDSLADSLNKQCSRSKDTFNRVFDFASKKNLVRGSDQKRIIEAVCRDLANTGWIENLWAIEKEAAEEYKCGLCGAILSGDVTDSSMGAMVEQSICSVCGNVATGELPEEEDFCEDILRFKGKEVPISGMSVIPFEINRSFNFFEDSLILPFKWGGKAGGEGADKDAKLLEVFSSKKKKAYETNPGLQNLTQDQSVYHMIGDIPDNVKNNKQEFLEEKKEDVKDFIDDQSSPGIYPESTIININYMGDDVDAIVVEEYEDGSLVVALEDMDDPIEISVDDVNDVVEYPKEMDYEHRMEAVDVHDYEMTPEDRAA